MTVSVFVEPDTISADSVAEGCLLNFWSQGEAVTVSLTPGQMWEVGNLIEERRARAQEKEKERQSERCAA